MEGARTESRGYGGSFGKVRSSVLGIETCSARRETARCEPAVAPRAGGAQSPGAQCLLHDVVLRGTLGRSRAHIDELCVSDEKARSDAARSASEEQVRSRPDLEEQV